MERGISFLNEVFLNKGENISVVCRVGSPQFLCAPPLSPQPKQRIERRRHNSEAELKFYLNTLQERRGQSQGRHRHRTLRGGSVYHNLAWRHFFD